MQRYEKKMEPLNFGLHIFKNMTKNLGGDSPGPLYWRTPLKGFGNITGTQAMSGVARVVLFRLSQSAVLLVAKCRFATVKQVVLRS
jgi:hypothetical protein